MASPFLGEIKMFGGNFAPYGYALCDGQLIAITQNSALFAILGTTFGGNGTSTFQLPNMQSRVPIHWGTGPGLTTYVLGETTGQESIQLNLSNLPQHNHTATLGASSAAGTSGAPTSGAVLAASTARDRLYSTNSADTALAGPTIGLTGSSVPHTNIQPVLAVTFIIATAGIFPSRN